MISTQFVALVAERFGWRRLDQGWASRGHFKSGVDGSEESGGSGQWEVWNCSDRREDELIALCGARFRWESRCGVHLAPPLGLTPE